MTVTGIVLAAGAGTRLGRPKADLILGGERLLDRAVRLLRAGGCDHLVAVVRRGTTVEGVHVVENPEPERGMGSSLQLGLRAAVGGRAVVTLVDLPGLEPDSVRRVLAAEAAVAVATYHGRRGHPVAFRADVWDEIARNAQGDQGARAFLRQRPDLVVDVACDGDPADLDTAADLERWSARRGLR